MIKITKNSRKPLTIGLKWSKIKLDKCERKRLFALSGMSGRISSERFVQTVFKEQSEKTKPPRGLNAERRI
ncbi:MAG TPA: hypothetical protein DER68_03970 [Ruminococcaceae bacterium]|nr:hypothetical protein [Oscillospiraceae bacterium]